MFDKLMRALGDGYHSFVDGLKEAWDAMQEGEAPGQAVQIGIPVHDCADDLNGLGEFSSDRA